MVHLNHFLRLFTIIICTFPLRADVIDFFDPLKEYQSSALTIHTNLFLANDMISLEELFGDWEKYFHPRSGKSIALQDMRIDIGGVFYRDLYIGYFYRYNVFIKTNKDFLDLYYTAKNKLDFYHDRTYLLGLDIEGIKENGVMISKNGVLYEDDTHSFKIGGAVSLSYGLDMQEGSMTGTAQTPSEKVYNVSANSASYYTHNYLYDLDVEEASGLGFGTNIALSYTNKAYNFSIKAIANDLYSRMYWKDLPYSFVDIQTENKSFDESGYVEYSPSISGLEIYKDFTQTITPRYKVNIKKEFYGHVAFSCGLVRAYGENIPYIRFDDKLSLDTDISLHYESRFNSFGFDYRYKGFVLGLATDSLSNMSAFGLRSSFQLQF